VTELSSLNGDLQSELSSLRHELSVANTELRVHTNRSASRAMVGDTAAPLPIAAGSTPGPSSSRVTEDSAVQTVPAEEAATSDRDQNAGGSSNPAMTAAARRSILATEAYVKDLQRQYVKKLEP
jgi:hypothetical protein